MRECENPGREKEGPISQTHADMCMHVVRSTPVGVQQPSSSCSSCPAAAVTAANNAPVMRHDERAAMPPDSCRVHAVEGVDACSKISYLYLHLWVGEDGVSA